MADKKSSEQKLEEILGSIKVVDTPTEEDSKDDNSIGDFSCKKNNNKIIQYLSSFVGAIALIGVGNNMYSNDNEQVSANDTSASYEVKTQSMVPVLDDKVYNLSIPSEQNSDKVTEPEKESMYVKPSIDNSHENKEPKDINEQPEDQTLSAAMLPELNPQLKIKEEGRDEAKVAENLSKKKSNARSNWQRRLEKYSDENGYPYPTKFTIQKGEKKVIELQLSGFVDDDSYETIGSAAREFNDMFITEDKNYIRRYEFEEVGLKEKYNGLLGFYTPENTYFDFGIIKVGGNEVFDYFVLMGSIIENDNSEADDFPKNLAKVIKTSFFGNNVESLEFEIGSGVITRTILNYNDDIYSNELFNNSAFNHVGKKFYYAYDKEAAHVIFLDVPNYKQKSKSENDLILFANYRLDFELIGKDDFKDMDMLKYYDPNNLNIRIAYMKNDDMLSEYKR